ncbi:hypothetical protein ACFXP7_05450 [Microbacterium sp. P06]|uniref:hypothetical protein n=1 Tax=Microbacterium sp. P06 TaxID=3366949 RepID=UPI0037459341
MAELLDWLDRLEKLGDEDAQSSHSVHFRLAASAPVDIDNFVFRAEDAHRQTESLGSVPRSLSILTFLDAGPQNPYRDQAVAAQLGAVFTLALGRRVQVAAGEMTTRMDGSENVTFIPSSVSGRDLLGPPHGNVRRKIENLLRKIAGLSRADADAVVAACELHYAATQLYDIDLNTAYTLVVAGIETLASHFEAGTTTWESFIEAARWDDVFERLSLNETQRDLLRTELLAGKHFRLRQRFATYVLRQLDPSFWRFAVPDFVPSLTMTAERSDFTGMTESAPVPMEHLVPKNPDILRRRLLASYDARSKFVHTGSKGLDENSAFVARTGRLTNAKEPLDFTGIRRILEWLLNQEISTRTTPTDLPDLRLRRNSPKRHQPPSTQSASRSRL